MKQKSFRYCMLVGSIALGAVALYYFVTYVKLTIALDNNGLKPDLIQPIEGCGWPLPPMPRSSHCFTCW